MEREMVYDVVVVGGGAAGVSAAVGAARAGARTVLVERYPFLGGAATISSVLTYCGFFTQGEEQEQVVSGVGGWLLERLGSIGFYDGPHRVPSTGNRIVPLDPEAVKLALDHLVQDGGVEPLLHTRVIGASVEDGRLRAIECADQGGRFTVRGEAFVDASGDAVLSHLAGAETRAGDSDGGLQTGSMVIRIGGASVESDVSPDEVARAVQKAKRDGVPNLVREKGIVARMPGSGDLISILVDEEVDGLSAPSMTRAEISGRQQAWAYLEVFRNYIPGCENAYLVSTGPQIGIRETRHAAGRYTLTGEEVLSATRHEDAVARGGWPVELHPAPGETIYHAIEDHSYYTIPYGCIVSVDLANLWAAGRAMSCDPVAFGSLRVMGTAFATGHAAGVGAATWLRNANHDAPEVRAELLRQEALV